MKIHNLMCFIGVLLILSSTTIAKERNKEIAVEIPPQQGSSTTEKKFTTLGFKGVHLGMSREKVKEIVTSGNGLDFKYGSVSDVSGKYVFLKSDSPIGCRGQGETEECYLIDTVSLQFFDDCVIQISLDSPEYTATDIDYYVKGWARFALALLKKKYGNPSKNNLSIERFNIFSVQSGYAVRLYEWNKKEEAVILAIGSNDFKYYAKIQYVNKKAYSRIEQEKRKIRSEM